MGGCEQKRYFTMLGQEIIHESVSGIPPIAQLDRAADF
jgi:hypothetical protein